MGRHWGKTGGLGAAAQALGVGGGGGARGNERRCLPPPPLSKSPVLLLLFSLKEAANTGASRREPGTGSRASGQGARGGTYFPPFHNWMLRHLQGIILSLVLVCLMISYTPVRLPWGKLQAGQWGCWDLCLLSSKHKLEQPGARPHGPPWMGVRIWMSNQILTPLPLPASLHPWGCCPPSASFHLPLPPPTFSPPHPDPPLN